MVATAPREVEVRIRLRGNIWRAYKDRIHRELLLEGPARTGKTFGLLLRMVQHAQEHPGYKGLIMRKVRATMGTTVLATLQEQVFHEWDSVARASVLDHVHFFGGSDSEPAAYMFDNGSILAIAGMDQASKVLGSEWDEIFCNEVIEFDEPDIGTLLTRLSHGILPGSMGYLLTDCNPTYDRHWVLKRANSGQMWHLRTTLRDNPGFYDEDQQPTERGLAYLETIGGLTGSTYQRLVLGEWVGMENAIYADALDVDTQFIALPDRVGWTGRGCGGMDFGRIHLSAVVGLTESHDGRLWVRECWTGHNDRGEILAAARRFRERYGIRRGVTDPLQDWAAQDLGWTIAKSGAGSRKGRIQRVLGMLENDQLRFDRYGEGVQELWDELHMYRYEVVETDTNIDDVVVRKDDDRVAALEYAIEGWLVPQLERRPSTPSKATPTLPQYSRPMVG